MKRIADPHLFLKVSWRFMLLLLIGVTTLLYYLSWWPQAMIQGQFFRPLYLIGFVIALIYCGAQFVGPWLIYVAASWRKNGPPTQGPELSIDVFIPVYEEPYVVVETTLHAACNMNGEHRTWLLDDAPKIDDDGNNPMQDLAIRLGAGYLARSERKGNKPGNVNAALAQTDGDIVVLFDVDHAPEPNFLTEAIPRFSDPEVGFVQVMLSFRNSDDSWVACSASDASLDFYNPTSLGLDAMNCATKMGTNILMRRKAIDDLGGYQYGLADDLSTSLALHAADWKSAYVAEPLAPGLIPNDLTSWFTQQLKWSRGVFEILLTEYTKLFSRLSLEEKLSYGVRVTYYWAGPVIAMHLAATLLVLFFGTPSLNAAFQNYLMHLIPMGLSAMLIRRQATKQWLHPKVSGSGNLIGATSLVYATWPIYLGSWIMALLRLPLKFILTPKERSGALSLIWLLPQILVSISLMLGSIYTWVNFPVRDTWLLLMWAVAQTVPMIIILWQWYCEYQEIGYVEPLNPSGQRTSITQSPSNHSNETVPTHLSEKKASSPERSGSAQRDSRSSQPLLHSVVD